ncbi:hypothetical protein OIU77_009398 [Salix suchowensis]|uniref:Uncharacterized protein n=1 Tax=Salix suchowensis TaxID=1278906 RepID=A0ABQ9AEW0_9ROSI|nr:hypothetical protein OIU78_024690 [Salix suchowensis]KAJ6333518.1 hypothetical protein OIU77_009398 [Salix suchowensis]
MAITVAYIQPERIEKRKELTENNGSTATGSIPIHGEILSTIASFSSLLTSFSHFLLLHMFAFFLGLDEAET